MKKIIAGFSGTREGMNDKQYEALVKALPEYNIQEAHHGSCVGSDAQFHEYCISKSIPVIIHPPINSYKRANCIGAKQILPPKDYLPRDEDIVNACDVLFATPKTMREKPRSGTWYTVRYAKNKKKNVILIYPTGFIEVF